MDEYTHPFGNASGSLSLSMTSPEMRHTSVELTWCAIGSSRASTRTSSAHVGQSTLAGASASSTGVLGAAGSGDGGRSSSGSASMPRNAEKPGTGGRIGCTGGSGSRAPAGDAGAGALCAWHAGSRRLDRPADSDSASRLCVGSAYTDRKVRRNWSLTVSQRESSNSFCLSATVQ